MQAPTTRFFMGVAIGVIGTLIMQPKTSTRPNAKWLASNATGFAQTVYTKSTGNCDIKFQFHGECRRLREVANLTKALCLIRIWGDCKKFPHMSNSTWFNDHLYGGLKDTSAGLCQARQASWETECLGAKVDMRYTWSMDDGLLERVHPCPKPPSPPTTLRNRIAAVPQAPFQHPDLANFTLAFGGERVPATDRLTMTKTWNSKTDYGIWLTRGYYTLRRRASGGDLHKEAKAYFLQRAAEVRSLHASQTLAQATALSEKWVAKPLFDQPLDPWALFEKLALIIDPTDTSLQLTTQFYHSLQVYEGMLMDGITDSMWLFLGLFHEIGKLVSLFGEVDENVYGLNKVLKDGVAGGGASTITTQWSSDELGYHRLKKYVLPEMAFVIRYQRCVPLKDGSLDHVLTAQELQWKKTLLNVNEYVEKTKSISRLPEVNVAKAQSIVYKFLPETIEF